LKDVNPNEIQYSSNLKRFLPHIVVFAALMVITYVAVVNSPILVVLTNIAFAQSQPNIKASSIYQTHTIVLGNDIKNLVIMIPDEGHEQPNQSPKELRIINQPYIPQNAVVNVGTAVTWFNADVDHPHRISLTPNNTSINTTNNNNNYSKTITYESGIIKNFTASKPIKFNNTGTFSYSGPSFDKGVPSYKMNGTLRVIKQPLSTPFNTTTNSSSSTSPAAVTTKKADTITTLMVPANQLSKAISGSNSQGFGIDNQYPFTSLRGGGSTPGGDKHQVLLVLTSSGKGLNEVISALNKIAPTMPYK
jgi:plastocyanin